MCILGLLLRIHPDIPFVCLHNRDEFLTRPVAPPHRDQAIIYGKDLQGNGTWMGYNTLTGIMVALTNVRNRSVLTPKQALSRGELVLKLLEHAIPGPTVNPTTDTSANASTSSASSSSPPYVTLDHIRQAASSSTSSGTALDLGQEYGPCNVIIASLIGQDGKYSDTYVPEAYFLSNCVLSSPATVNPASSSSTSSSSSTDASFSSDTSPATSSSMPNLTIRTDSSTHPHPHPTYASRYATVQHIEPGIHVLSNSVLDDEHWDKVRYLKHQLRTYTTNEYTLPTLQELVQRYQQQKSTVVSSPMDQNLPPASSVAHPEYFHDAEMALVEIVLNQLVPLMTSPHPVPTDIQQSSKGDLSWSPLAKELESTLQQHIFIPQNKLYNYGTRALSIVLQIGKSVYYCYSSFDPEDPLTIDRTQSSSTSERLATSLARQINAIANPAVLAKGETSGQLHTSIPRADSEGVHATVHSAITTGIGVSTELIELPKSDPTVNIVPSRTDNLQESQRTKSHKHAFVEVAGVQWIILRSELTHTISPSSSSTL